MPPITSASATRDAVTVEVDARVPDRVCCRRESARTGAALRAAESALSGAQTELVSVKRRLRQYASTLDAVSVHAKEEIGVALAARNGALAAASTSAAERDALSAKADSLTSALAAARAEHAELKRRHALVDTALTKSVEEVSRLRREFERAKRAANASSARATALEREKSQMSGDVTALRLSRRAVMEERDEAVDSLNDVRTELAATKMELAMVRHQLQTRAPPEISQNVRRDIAEGAAAAVERRTLGMIRAVARHYLDFGLDRPEPVIKEGIPGDETEEDIPDEEEPEIVAREIPTPLDLGVEDEEAAEPELPDADAILAEHMASISQITATADAESPAAPAAAATAVPLSTAVVDEGPAPGEDEPEQIARPVEASSPVTPSHGVADLVVPSTEAPVAEAVSKGLDLTADEPVQETEEMPGAVEDAPEEALVEETPVDAGVVQKVADEQADVPETTVEDAAVENGPVDEAVADMAVVDEAVVMEGVVADAQVEEKIVKEAVVCETPVEEVLGEAVVDKAAVEEDVVEEAGVGEAPVEVALEEAVVDKAAVEEDVVEEAGVGEAPVEEDAVKEAVVREAPVGGEVVEETVVDEAPVEEALTKEAVVQEADVGPVAEETAVRQAPAHSPVIEETGAIDGSVKDAPVQAATVEETATDKSPAEVTERELAEAEVVQESVPEEPSTAAAPIETAAPKDMPPVEAQIEEAQPDAEQCPDGSSPGTEATEAETPGAEAGIVGEAVVQAEGPVEESVGEISSTARSEDTAPPAADRVAEDTTTAEPVATDEPIADATEEPDVCTKETPAVPPQVVIMDDASFEHKVPDLPVKDPQAAAATAPEPSSSATAGSTAVASDPFLQETSSAGTGTEQVVPPPVESPAEPTSNVAGETVDDTRLPQVADTVEVIEEQIEEEDLPHVVSADQSTVLDTALDPTDVHAPAGSDKGVRSGAEPAEPAEPVSAHASYVAPTVQVGAGPEAFSETYESEDVDEVVDIAAHHATPEYTDEVVDKSDGEEADSEIDISGEPTALLPGMAGGDDDLQYMDDLESCSIQSADSRKWSGPPF